ncbi:TetR family transcriptional regulator [Actinoplanes sp. LDG1-01]|uniref:TetR family transcriptional regulator n=1 Tax=Paractinoplanes lichenicola TaxID=2802976 RepID=A0ABS1W1F5_9ACTN|nr:TetR family transcriptional regulator [Actinoplanes lichenicola]
MSNSAPHSNAPADAADGTAPARRRADRAPQPEAAARPRRRRSDREPQHDDSPAPGQPARRRADGEPRRPQRARDPEARRRALAAAALEVISESGLARTSHRAVAAKADLPLGATTYYFPTLDDLIAAGLQLAAAGLQDDFDRWAGRLREADDIPAAVAELIVEYLADRRRAQLECELYVAAARDAALRPLAMAWLTGMRDILEPHLGHDATHDVMALFDGVTLQALITGQEVDPVALTATVRRLTRP